MFRKTAVASAALIIVATPALAKAPTRTHRYQYNVAYYKVQHEFGHRAPGCNLLKGYCHDVQMTDASVTKSISVLERMLHPVHIVTTMYVPASSPSTSSTPVNTGSVAHTSSASSGVVACIINAESSGNPTASNGAYSGLGGWNQTAWQQDGGTRFAPTPTQASYSQQVTVLNNEGSSPQGYGQQTNFDGC